AADVDRERTGRRVRVMACAGVLAALSACSLLGGGAPADTPQQIAAREEADARIRREVEARLAAEPTIGAGRVRADVAAGEVRLHGAVQGFGALRCAINNAELVPGVRLVIDFLVLEPGPRDVRCLAPRVFTLP
ncbi:MAG TPA: BON domain-containing protein, partial [Longimicrobium sp.]|nr:BON domain-containing protein [Longimicrobium sp.]